MLGYYIFFNMRQPDSGLAIEKHEVQEAASMAGMHYDAAAWELFDRNNDDCATLEEVMDAVQEVPHPVQSQPVAPVCSASAPRCFSGGTMLRLSAVGGGALGHAPICCCCMTVR